MANTKSAIKAMRQSERRRIQNRIIRSRTRTYVKKARTAIGSASQAETEQALRAAISALDRAVNKGIIHRNNAARHKARLMHLYQEAQGESA